MWCVECVVEGELEVTQYDLAEENGARYRFSCTQQVKTGIGDAGCELLVVVERRAATAGTLHLGAPDGPAVTLLYPPYPLPPPKGVEAD